jgi:IS30 family transposase
MARVKRFQGRVEFLAVENDVRSMVSSGYSYKMIHESLTQSCRITISYDTFYNYLRRKKEQVKPSLPVLKTVSALGDRQTVPSPDEPQQRSQNGSIQINSDPDHRKKRYE